jgi:hypothetical protein
MIFIRGADELRLALLWGALLVAVSVVSVLIGRMRQRQRRLRVQRMARATLGAGLGGVTMAEAAAGVAEFARQMQAAQHKEPTPVA